MKKLIIFMLILGLFALAGCDSKNPNSESSNSNQSTTETTHNEPAESIDNETPSSDLEGDELSTTTGETKDDDVYNDDIPWGPLH